MKKDEVRAICGTRGGEGKYIQDFDGGKTGGKSLFGRLGRGKEDDIKTDLK